MSTQAAAGDASDSVVIDQAVAWLTHLWSGTADDASRAQWRQWRAEHPAHERAWQQIETVEGRLALRASGLSADTAVAALATSTSANRRQALKMLSLAFVTAGGAWMAYRELPWREWSADLRTAAGERSAMTLADGTQLHLNTDTAVDLRYDATQRTLRLLRGEIMVATAADTVMPARPFSVQTEAGRIRPIGTRFLVRQVGNASHVAVLEGVVELQPADDVAPPSRLRANQAAAFTASGLQSAPQPLGTQAAWTEGVLIASNTRLGDFIADLQRYRPGKLSCDTAVADLRLSGIFPLGNTDRVLLSLTEVLPVGLKSFGPWWSRIGPLDP